MGHLEFGILRTGFPYGPVVWDFRTLCNLETVGAQSQHSVRERTLRIKYYFNSIARVPTNLVPLKVRPHSVQDERVRLIAKCSLKTKTLSFH